MNVLFVLFKLYSYLNSVSFIHLTPGRDNFCLIHVSLVPVLNVVGEQVNFSGIISLYTF